MQPEAGMECGVVSKLLWSRQSFAFFIDQPTFHIRPIFFSTTKCCNFGVSERLGVRLLAFRRFTISTRIVHCEQPLTLTVYSCVPGLSLCMVSVGPSRNASCFWPSLPV